MKRFLGLLRKLAGHQKFVTIRCMIKKSLHAGGYRKFMLGRIKYTHKDIEEYKKTLQVGQSITLGCYSTWFGDHVLEYHYKGERTFEITGIYPNFVTVKGMNPSVLYYVDMMENRCFA